MNGPGNRISALSPRPGKSQTGHDAPSPVAGGQPKANESEASDSSTRRLPCGQPKAQPRKDKAFRDAAARLGWHAVVALGLEAGNWLKIAVTADVESVEKNGQMHHADEYRARVVVWTQDKLFGEMVRDELLAQAARDHLRLDKSFVAMTVAACRVAIAEAGNRANVGLFTTAEWIAEVERRVG